MSAVLPLPLELTRPMELASSLEDSLKEMFQVATLKYNPETQVRETSEGVAILYNGGCGGSRSSQESETTSVVAIDLQLDLQIDDNDF